MKRILLTHNFYGSFAPSGENQVFEAEKKLLQQHGHEVTEFTRHSDEIRQQGKWGILKGALSTPWNPWATQVLLRKVKTFKPDIVHVHNTFPLISPAIFHAISRHTATVLTLHNYRLFCPAAIPMREGKVCTQCLDQNTTLPSLQHGCYRNSRLATLPLALSVSLHRSVGTWTKHVDAFITLSDFQRHRMIDAGLPAAKVHVKPNFYPGSPPVISWKKRQPYVVFVGRLTAEKGVINLLNAWRSWGKNAPELRLIGDGELRTTLEALGTHLPVRFLGQVNSKVAQAQIANAKLLILPSECFEGFPMVIREAFAFGTPVAVSNIGPLPSIVTHGLNGVVFKTADPQSLLETVKLAWDTPGLLETFATAARQAFEQHYNETANYQTLMNIYNQAMQKIKS